MRIKDIPPENRPRERFQKHGPSALSDAEILAIILQTGHMPGEKLAISTVLCSRMIAVP
jgi:DNA repair protein RadC